MSQGDDPSLLKPLATEPPAAPPTAPPLAAPPVAPPAAAPPAAATQPPPAVPAAPAPAAPVEPAPKRASVAGEPEAPPKRPSASGDPAQKSSSYKVKATVRKIEEDDEEDVTPVKDKKTPLKKKTPPKEEEYEDDYEEDDQYEEPQFEGDVSTWGRKRNPEVYHDGKSEDSYYTMSSGLSPRGDDYDDAPQHKEFNLKTARNTLAYNAAMFGKAQTLRKGGQAPKALGIADDLPDRMAFHSLNQLAGMARKVQDCIEHNKRVFQQRVLAEDQAIVKRAFHGWRAARFGTLAKQQLMARACAKMLRFRLAKAFYAWKDRFGAIDRCYAMWKKLQATIGRGRMRRCFLGWRKQVEDRWWKTQLETRDSRIHQLEKKIGGYELRPIIVLRKRKLSMILTAWYNMCEDARKRRLRLEKAARHFRNGVLGKAWNSWMDLHLTKQRHKGLLTKAAGRMRNLAIERAWNKWMELIEEKRAHTNKMNRALLHWANKGLWSAWSAWWSYILLIRRERQIVSRWKQPMKAKAFYSWVEFVQWRKRMRVVMERTGLRLRNAALARAWDTWRGAVEDSKNNFHLTKKEELALQCKAMQEENERLRRDNERFVRLIDSGEWGRGRVSELVSAGEVLKGERDALMKLIQSMRKEYEAVQGAKGAQEEEVRRLKERMMLGGAARNKLLVKGASSYNALKRAIKQEVIDTQGAHPQDPNVLFEIDKLSLERVGVFPDGDINIQALASTPGSAAFSKPVSAVSGLRTSTGPVYTSQTPSSLAGIATGRQTATPTKMVTGRTVEIMSRLQGLSAAELDEVEARLRQEAGRPQGLASTTGAPPTGGFQFPYTAPRN